MTHANPSPSDDAIPTNRVVRWVLLAAVILFSVGLYFRFGTRVPPLGTVPPTATSTP